MNPALGLVLVLFLIVANGFFVAAEFALVAVDRAKVENDVEAGRRRARGAWVVVRQGGGSAAGDCRPRRVLSGSPVGPSGT